MRGLIQQALIYAVYFAPRGRERLLSLGEQISQRHLGYNDKLIGIVGDAGSGKSLIIKGMFPGLELANDDHGVNASSILQFKNTLDNNFDFTTYHIDMRFQMAFTQMFEIVEFVKNALSHNRRVIIEHFDLLYPYLNINAEIMIGIGEEIIVTRPNMFGPLPKDIYNIVFDSLKYRRMAHTAEDIATLVIKKHYQIPFKILNSDVRGGFVLNFEEKPDLDLDELESRVKKIIDKCVSVSYYDENHIKIGDEMLECTGPRIHMKNTSEVKNFRLVKEIKYDFLNNVYALVGLVGDRDIDLEDLNKISREED